MILLHAFIKKQQKTPINDIELAAMRLKTIKSSVNHKIALNKKIMELI